jgi:hypothetical protein
MAHFAREIERRVVRNALLDATQRILTRHP